MGLRSVTLIIAATVVAGVIFTSAKQRSSAQQDPIRKQPACTIFCGDGTFNTFSLGAKPCWGGPLPAESAGSHFNELAEADQAAICRNLAAANKPRQSCPAFKTLAQLCKDKAPDKEDCEKPTPWFGTPPAGCKDIQTWAVLTEGREVTLTICGEPVFRYVMQREGNIYPGTLLTRVQESAGTRICCDKFREAARTGVPCDPRADVDCDGRPNEKDVLRDSPAEGQSLFSGIPYPAINRVFSTPEGAAIDPFPPGLNSDDTDFFPPQDKCDCKWELMKGTLTCSSDGRQPHTYQARWRCPSSGNERFTRKEAAASAPCTQPQRSTP